MVQRSSIIGGTDDSVGGTHDGSNINSSFLRDRFFGVFESKEELIERSTIAGQIGPIMRKFILSREQLHAIVEGIRSVAQVSDICLLLTVGWILVPFIDFWYDRLVVESSTWWRIRNRRNTRSVARDDDVDEDENSGFTSSSSSSSSITSNNEMNDDDSFAPRPFQRTKVYHFFNTLSEIARLATVVYAVDMIKIFLLGAGFDIPKSNNVTHVVMYVVYTIWGFHRVSRFKRYVLKKGFQHTVAEPGRIHVIDRLTDVGLMLLTIFILLEILNVKMGVAVKGVVAVGSIWTVVVSLAVKEIVSNFIHGILLSASDRIYEGDSIRLPESDFRGTVARLGWLETVLRGPDDVIVTIPNAQLQGEQVANLSRVNVCQVYQTLRFSYSDSQKLPKLMHDIKREIRGSCPSVITDGTRPFRCYWTRFQSNYLEVIVDAHFRIRPVGDAYFENQQRTLQAIDRAVRGNELKYHGT